MVRLLISPMYGPDAGPSTGHAWLDESVREWRKALTIPPIYPEDFPAASAAELDDAIGTITGRIRNGETRLRVDLAYLLEQRGYAKAAIQLLTTLSTEADARAADRLVALLIRSGDLAAAFTAIVIYGCSLGTVQRKNIIDRATDTESDQLSVIRHACRYGLLPNGTPNDRPSGRFSRWNLWDALAGGGSAIP